MNSTFSSHCSSIVSVTTFGDLAIDQGVESVEGVEDEIELVFVLPLDEWDFQDINNTIYTVNTASLDPLNFFEASFLENEEIQENGEDDIVENILASLHLEDNGLDE